MNEELANVLEAKEQRWNKRLELSRKYKCTVVSISLCVPLKYRTNTYCKDIFVSLCNMYMQYAKEKGFELIYEGKVDGADGPTIFLISHNNSLEVKKISAEFETLKKPFRIMDIDIMDENLNPISREDINLPPRKCFICENESAVCVKAKNHTKEELEKYITDYFKEAELLIK